MGGYFTTLKEKTLNETFPFVKAKLHSGKKKTLDYVSSLYYSKRAPIEKYGEECEDIEKDLGRFRGRVRGDVTRARRRWVRVSRAVFF